MDDDKIDVSWSTGTDPLADIEAANERIKSDVGLKPHRPHYVFWGRDKNGRGIMIDAFADHSTLDIEELSKLLG